MAVPAIITKSYTQKKSMSDHNPLLSADEWAFIQNIDSRFPDKNIAANFNTYLNLSPADRISQAQADRKHILRAGWKIRGIPEIDTETVSEHIENMKSVAIDYLPGHENLDIILAIVECHDTGEVIIGDFIPQRFIPGDAISRDDQQHLEWLAVKIIYETQPEMADYYQDYVDQRTAEAKIVRDLDKGQMFLRARQYGLTHPHVDLSEFLLDCQDYTWQTQEGITLFYQAFKKIT